MELYKLKDGKLIKYNGGFVVVEEEGRIYTNPSEEEIRKAGYKPLVFDGEPEYDEATQYLVRDIEEQDECYIVHWVVKEHIFEAE